MMIVLHVGRVILLVSVLQGMLNEGAATDCVGGKVSNEVWNEGPCKRCSCEDGKVKCTNLCKKKISNTEVSRTPRKTRTFLEYSCTHDNIERSDNESWHESGKHAKFLKTKGECMQCHCNKQIVTCTIRKCPIVSCKKLPIRKHGSCCLFCPDEKKKADNSDGHVCYQSGSTFKKEATWKMYIPVKKGHGHCLRCKCNKHKESSFRHVCTRHKCPLLTCNNPVGKPGRCCGICRDSTKRTRRTDDRTKINEKRKINLMIFDIFKVIRERIYPKKQDELTSAPVDLNIAAKQLKKGKKDCVFGIRKIYKHGEQFIPTISSCLRCHCQNAHVQCSKIVCPVSYECPNPANQPGLCCKVCPGVPVKKAKRLEERNVVKIIKKSNGCSRSRADYVHVYQYYPAEDEATNRFNTFYLFHRISNNKDSEMHAWELNGDITTVRISIVDDVKPLKSRSKYLGYIKERILKRINRHERELKGLQGRIQCILKIASMKKIISEKVRKKRHCKPSPSAVDTSSVLKTLQEVD